LARFVETPETEYEKLEGLEQLRCLAMGIKMRVVDVDYRGLPQMSGVDTAQDVDRVEVLLKAAA